MKQFAQALASFWLISAPAVAEVYATIGGKELEANVETRNSTIYSRLGQAQELRQSAEQSGLPVDEETLRAIELADRYRTKLEASIISLMAPSECRQSASDEELSAFISWWRSETDARLPEGLETEIETGIRQSPAFRRDLVSAENRHALEVARIVVENWKLLRCIDAEHPGLLYRDYTPPYFTAPASEDISVFNALPMPALIEVMPVSAVAKLFESAIQSGSLSFANETYKSVFMVRYTTPELARFGSAAAAVYFSEPYWLQPASPDAE